MLRFNVDWTVSGSSVVRVSEEELAEIGIDPNDFSSDKELFLAIDKAYSYGLSDDVVADYDERQRPEITNVYIEEEF
jgi:hypothetical protein